ncbi:MAG: thymidine phosphorylase [Bacilli bacterium]|nr:thymidine phosphorylase [Bacilli bacterium]
MHIIDIINKKRVGQALCKEEISFVVENYVDGNIEEYQMSSLLMAICINGMNAEETSYLTECMLHSGDTIDLSEITTTKVDKHSTGGIGDKTTLVVAPLVASLGIPVAKMSGRGLGLTGGTIDKLESIQDFNVDLPREAFIGQVKKIGIALASQTGNLVPADKKMYALRDVTGTVSSIPLIASSIMSKKLASGADKFVIDVKVGKGALMQTIEDASALAHLMVEIGAHHKKEVICLLTNMNAPLGKAIGNGLEVIEAIDTLKGKGPKDLENLAIELGSYMVHAGKGIALEEARALCKENLSNGKAYETFEELVKAQNGNSKAIAVSTNQIDIKSDESGIVTKLDANLVGQFVHDLGAGRETKQDKIDYGVGVVLHKKIGDRVNQGEVLYTVYYTKEISFAALKKAYQIECFLEEETPLLLEVIR